MKKYILIGLIGVVILALSPYIYWYGGHFLGYYFGCQYEIDKYIDSAVENQDISYCENIIENLEKVECFKQDSRNLSATYEFCSEKNGIIRSYCYSDDVESKCYRRLAVNSLDIETCNKMSNGSTFNFQRNQCYRSIANVLRDHTICNNLEANSKALCYGDIASKKKDPNICFLLSSEHNLESNPIIGSSIWSADSESGVCLQNMWNLHSIERQVCEDVVGEENHSMCYDSYQK